MRKSCRDDSGNSLLGDSYVVTQEKGKHRLFLWRVVYLATGTTTKRREVPIGKPPTLEVARAQIPPSLKFNPPEKHEIDLGIVGTWL